MKHKSIFKASFEESLNLEDDGMVSLQQKPHDKTATFFHEGRPTLWFRIRCFLVTLIFPVGLNGLWVFLSKELQNSSFKKLSFYPPHHHLPNSTIFFALLALWLLFVLLGKFFRQAVILPYRYQFHCFTYLVSLYIMFDLLAINVLLSNLPLVVVLILVLVVVTLMYLMYHSKMITLRNMLYHQSYKPKLLDKIAKFIGLYGLGLLAIVTVLNKVLLSILGKPSASLENLGMLGVCFIANLLIPAIVIYIGIPYFLQAYYKLKYPEEYRNWEGKTVEEWYGRKYLKHHKELLENK